MQFCISLKDISWSKLFFLTSCVFLLKPFITKTFILFPIINYKTRVLVFLYIFFSIKMEEKNRSNQAFSKQSFTQNWLIILESDLLNSSLLPIELKIPRNFEEYQFTVVHKHNGKKQEFLSLDSFVNPTQFVYADTIYEML